MEAGPGLTHWLCLIGYHTSLFSQVLVAFVRSLCSYAVVCVCLWWAWGGWCVVPALSISVVAVLAAIHGEQESLHL